MRRTITLLSRSSVVICGGGPVGNSIALHLAQRGKKDVVVIERDPTFKKASCMLSAGGIRQQFSVEENILMSIYGAHFIKNMPTSLIVNGQVPDVQFHENGYLFLATNNAILPSNLTIQHKCGADWISLLKPDELEAKFPWLNVEGLSVGSFSTANEGYFDPWEFVLAMKRKAIHLGVKYVDATIVKAKLNELQIVSGVVVRSKCGSESSIDGEVFVNAAGAWSGKLLELMAAASPSPTSISRLPVKPRKRCIFIVHCPGQQKSNKPIPPANTPLVIDPSGVYFRPEGAGGRFLTGVSPEAHEDPDCEDTDLDIIDHHLFEDRIWPVLYDRVPAFQELKVQSSWAGFYEYNTLDQNAIIGFHPELKNVMLCNGFSGHGLQQSPAAGRAVAELLTTGHFETIDLNRFSFDRVLNNTPVYETGIV